MAEDIVIKAKVESGEANANVDKLNNKLKETGDTATQTGAKLGKALKSFSESTEAVTGAYVGFQSVLLLTNSASEETNAIMSKIVAVQGAFNAVKMVGNSLMAENNILTRASTTATTVYSGVQKALTAVTNGTSGAMKILRLAMLALPIVAIIAGLTALVMWLVSTSKATKELEEANNNTTKSYEKLTKATKDFYDNELKNINNSIKLAQSENASRQELFDLEIERLRIMENQRKENVKNELDFINTKREQYKKALELGNEDLARSIKQEIATHKEKYLELRKLDGNYEVDKQVLTNKNRLAEEKEREDEQKKIDDERQKAWEKRKSELEKQAQERKALEEAYANDLLNVRQKAEDIAIANIKDNLTRQEAQIAISYERQIEAVKAKYGAENELIKQLENNREAELEALREATITENEAKELERLNNYNLTKLELELSAIVQANEARENLSIELINSEFEARKLLLEEQMKQELDNTELTESEKALIRERYRQEEIDAEAEKQKKIIAEEQKAQQQKQKLQEQAFEALNALNDLVFDLLSANVEKGSKKEEELARKKFNINKALQIAQATTTGVQTVMNAFQSGMAVPILGPATGAAFAIAAAIPVAANIAKIATSKFEPSSGGGGGASGGGASVATIPTAPPIADNGAGTFNPAGEIPNLTDINNSGGGGNVKVVLSDSDLKANEKNSKKIEIINKGG